VRQAGVASHGDEGRGAGDEVARAVGNALRFKEGFRLVYCGGEARGLDP
jgi:hypothetical protein